MLAELSMILLPIMGVQSGDDSNATVTVVNSFPVCDPDDGSQQEECITSNGSTIRLNYGAISSGV